MIRERIQKWLFVLLYRSGLTPEAYKYLINTIIRYATKSRGGLYQIKAVTNQPYLAKAAIAKQDPHHRVIPKALYQPAFDTNASQSALYKSSV